ncbi:Ppx/GppA phosphatase family protein [Heliorestis convoluta]|uniref:Exopolyphosphatase Ppx/GppA n=1 Tax=Heliorestis convoluta TaxID=356322 RepID=A0A5Q2N145_9FIRM|nr:Ppx/GppA family phosphatase [Heliorestis convoluta]QGG48718.1 exopolyphosphatase Ppx/GppA [Heliorestis convoluta]
MEHEKRYGAIDIGSNSLRFLVASVQAGRLLPLWRHLETTRLGQKVDQDGRLSPEAIERTIEALRRGLEVMKEQALATPYIAAFATSAVREATNGQLFCDRVQRELGLSVKVLSGEMEGRLSYEGALVMMDSKSLDGKVPVVIDIGGGSTEVVWYDQSWWRKSLPLGALRVTERKWSAREIVQAWQPLTTILQEQLRGKAPLLVGVGGTVTTLGAMVLKMSVYDPDRVHGTRLSLEQTKSYAKELALLSTEERKKIAGLQPERADIIPAGVEVLAQFMEHAGFSSVVVSETDLLHQALWEIAKGRW